MRILLVNSWKAAVIDSACGGAERLLISTARRLKLCGNKVAIACTDGRVPGIRMLSYCKLKGTPPLSVASYIQFVLDQMQGYDKVISFEFPEVLYHSDRPMLCWYMNHRDSWLPDGEISRNHVLAFVSEDMRRAFHADATHRNGNRLVVLRPGIDLARFAFNPRHKPRDVCHSPFVIGSGSEWHEGKGLHTFLTVCEALHAEGLSHRAILFGGSDLWALGRLSKHIYPASQRMAYKRRLLQTASRLPCAEVWGKIAYIHMPQLYREIDIFCFLSTFQEGFPLTVIEALASGCIVIANSVGGVVELIHEGSNGFLVNPDNHRDVVDLVKVLAKYPGLRACIRSRATQSVSAYSVNETVRNILRTLHEL